MSKETEKSYSKLFAERLKDFRTEQNLSIEQLSKEVGVSKMAISLWENEKRVPTMLALIDLAKFFKVSTDYLCGLEE